MRPRVKGFPRRLDADEITLSPDAGREFVIPDPDGQVRSLLALLDGTRTGTEAAAEMRRRWPDLADSDVQDGIRVLDQAGLLEDADAGTELTEWQRERYFSNLAFFSTFATLSRSRYWFQERLRRSHVLLLGVGGLGSTVLYNLAGLGLGRVTILDGDQVELKNLARQFLYGEDVVGRSKVECAAERIGAFNSELHVVPVQARLHGPDDLSGLLDGVDLVVSAVDQPPTVQDWVNEACVAAGVPFVTGGFQSTRGMYYSVVPGQTGCRACMETQRRREVPGDPLEIVERVNRGIGPVASFLSSLVALEALRHLTGFAPPISAGRIWLVDFVQGRTDVGFEWSRLSGCDVCGECVLQDRSQLTEA